MRQLVITPKFRRVYRRIAKRDRARQARIDDVLRQIEALPLNFSLRRCAKTQTISEQDEPAASTHVRRNRPRPIRVDRHSGRRDQAGLQSHV